MSAHHAKVFKRGGRWPWRVECTCGNWQQGDRWRAAFDWAFDHVRTEGRPII